MSRRRKRERRGVLPKRLDPRRLTDDRDKIINEGGPHDEGLVYLDVKDAVLLDGCTVSRVDAIRGGEAEGTGDTVALELSGRVNKTEDRVALLFLMPPDGAAGIVTELIGVAQRGIPELAVRIEQRLAALPGPPSDDGEAKADAG